MTGDKSKFSHLVPKDQGYVTFGDNNQGKIIGIGKIGTFPNPCIENVLHVEGLKHNLLSISQLCDKGNRVIFDSDRCIIEGKIDNLIKLIARRINNVYIIDFNSIPSNDAKCLLSNEDESWLWHRRIGHIHMAHLNKISSKNLVVGLPKQNFTFSEKCDPCSKSKLTRANFPSKNLVSTQRPLELLHMDLFGPCQTKSFGGNYYCLVIVDDYSRYTWTLFITHKNDAFHEFKKLAKIIQNQLHLSITSIRTDHGGEFENSSFEKFCEKHGVKHYFSAPRTPEQNGVVERKNRSLKELSRTMLNDMNLPAYFWADAVSTACYVMNRVLIRPILKKTPYELYKGRKPNISHLRVFGCKCYVHNNGRDNLGSFEARADEGIFLGYSASSKAYRIYNKSRNTIEESIHVSFDESDPRRLGKVSVNDVSGILGDLFTNEDEEQNATPKEQSKGNGI